jgi:hypothetical protein
MPAVIFILVEQHERGFTATARDECGTVATATHRRRAVAVDDVKGRVAEQLGACRFQVKGLGGGSNQ